MEVNAEIRKYEETVNHLFKMLKTVCQERDEARHQLQLLLRNLQPSSTAETSHSEPCPYELSLASLQPSHEKLSSSRDKLLVDGDSLVIDKMVCGKPLPQKGNLLRTVTEAGPLLHTLLIDPLPRWQNPPSFSSCGLAPKRTRGNESFATVVDQTSAHQNSVIVTSLSLTVPGNSCQASLPLAPGSGPSVNNKPFPCLYNDSDMMLDNIFNRKKRKLV